ncbi:MAG: NADH:flavin oxidoreductase [Deltaproteobacteria bacterium]|nr:NADH:flavin oxidoreductase [Deltaproteobacteria bacterium]
MSEIFESVRLGSLTLPHRVGRAATWLGLASPEGLVTPEMTEVLVALAQGGAGLIITGHAYVHPAGRHSPAQLGVDDDDKIPGLTGLARAVRAAGGFPALQLGFGGHYLSAARVAALTPDDLAGLARAFGRAAARAQAAGFVAVEILAAHGFLLSQLLCPRYNPRGDAYGGDLASRARALREVLAQVRGAVGPEFPILVKLNVADFVPEGLVLEESLQVGEWLAAEGADALELSGGLLNAVGRWNRPPATPAEEAWFQKEARAFRARLALPLILGGGIRSWEVASALVGADGLDLVALCRPFIREPGLVARWRAGDHAAAACQGCANCFEEIKAGRGPVCVPPRREPPAFFPQDSRTVPAGPALPPGTAYRVTLGLEEWEGAFLPMLRVEMLVPGEDQPRLPSFPPGDDAPRRLKAAAAQLWEQYAG